MRRPAPQRYRLDAADLQLVAARDEFAGPNGLCFSPDERTLYVNDSDANLIKAFDAGADGLVVSNHGGRQLDGVAATLRILPEVVTAVGTQTEVLFDGGIRRGSDIVKALALGARAVLVLTVFQLILPLTAPLIDLFAIYSIVFLDPMPILAYWLAFNLFQFTLAWVAFGFDGESRRDLWALPLQQFCHRQVSYLVVYDGVISALLGSHLSWHRIERTGQVAAVAGEPEARRA